jgi:threonine dehydratase
MRGNEVSAMIPSDKQVEHARELLSRYFRPTRLVSAESLAQRSGAHVHLKIESDLPTGSFKPRGALNALLTTAGPVPGVVAASTGNHGAAVAYAARIAKVGATIFLQENPNPVKRAHCRAWRKSNRTRRHGWIGSERRRCRVCARARPLFSRRCERSARSGGHRHDRQ